MPKKPQKPAKPLRKSAGKALRDSVIVSKALAGKSNTEIAEELNLDRGTVTRALNSEGIKRLTEEIDGKLAAGVDKAIKVVLDSAAKDLGTAIDLLKNFGSMRTSLKLEHTGPGGESLNRRPIEEIDARIKEILGKDGK